MKNRIVVTVFLLVLFQIVEAQNEMDVLRYSTTDVFGTARFEAMAGSFGALGADVSTSQVNPASLGRFSSSRVGISFNNSILKNQAEYNATTTLSDANKFTVSNLAVVFTNDLSGSSASGRKYGQLTLGYNRLKNFGNSRIYSGKNFYSLLDVFANDGYGIDPDYIYEDRPFTTGLAYDVYAVDYDNSSGEYYSRLTMGDMMHLRQINTDGGIGEFHIGYSENYRDVLYYGANIGIRRVKYTEEIFHTESLLETEGTTLRSFDYMYNQESKGLGLNLKLGLLYLPIQEFRVGLSFESPTVISMKDVWTADMRAEHDYGVESIDPIYVPEGNYEYKVKTPMKWRASFAYIFGMKGAINVDLEASRLPGGRLKPTAQNIQEGIGYNFGYENDEVKNQFRTVLNTRIGIEYMVFRNVYLRGGIAILPQPYKKEIGNITTPNMTYAGGIGWENHFISINLAYRMLQLHEDYFAFDPSKIENRVEITTNVHNLVLTATYKF